MQLLGRDRCPACTASGAATLLSLPYDRGEIADYLERAYHGRFTTSPLEGQRYELHRCARCGLVYQGFVPDPEYMSEIYGRGSIDDQDEVAANRGLSVRRNYANEVEQLLVHAGRAPAEVQVLDFGSGSGLWLQMAAAWGCSTHGAELSDAGRERITALGHTAHHPAELPAERFDYINAEQVLEHMAEPLEVARSLAAALAPGGLLRINVPNGSDIEELLADPDWSAPKGSARSLNAVAPLEHVNCFDHGSLRRLGTSAGLEPFHYPTRQFLTPMTRARFGVSAVVHRVRPPRGTLQLFRRTR